MTKTTIKTTLLTISGILYIFAGAYSSASAFIHLPHVQEVALSTLVIGGVFSGLLKLLTGTLEDKDQDGIPDSVETPKGE